MSAVTEYKVSGMSCSHCEAAVREEVTQLAGVEAVEVSAADGRLVVTADEAVDAAAVIAAVDEAGYDAASAA